MTDRDVRELLRRSFEGIVERHGVGRAYSRACALELLAALDGQRIRLVRPAHLHNPDADYRLKPPAGDPVTGAEAVRAAFYEKRLHGTGICPLCRTGQPLTVIGRIADHELATGDQPPAGCLGAGLEPLNTDRTTP